MKKILAAAGWLILFVAVGCLVMAAVSLGLLRHGVPPWVLLRLAALGLVPGGLAWVIALVFAALPGARRAPGAAQSFGLAQGLWAIGGSGLMLACGAFLPYAAAVYLEMLRRLANLPSHMPDQHDIPLLLASLLASELLTALWLVWYVRRQGPARLQDGSAAGIAWRPAPPRAYGLAALSALAVLLLVAGEAAMLPPDSSKLQDLELAQLLQGPPAIALLAAAVIIVMAPIVEELLFRGLAFAGIAARLGPGWAVALTTIIFTAVHAPEKILYPPGFVDVAAVALLSCWLRLRYRSIRPGMVMHFLYNGSMLVVPLMAGGH
jgi:membrane protease YdiL (CAAX protease family)